jgi:hypothetical protein
LLALSCSLSPAEQKVDQCPEGSWSERPPETLDAFLEHACLHAKEGPFVDMDATKGPVLLTNTHTGYRVRLDESRRGEAEYVPKVTATFAFFDDGRGDLIVRNKGGTRVCPVLTTRRSACPELGRVAFFELNRKSAVVLSIDHQGEPPSAPPALVIVEEWFE